MTVFALGILAFLVMAQTLMIIILIQTVHDLRMDIKIMHNALEIWLSKEGEEE